MPLVEAQAGWGCCDGCCDQYYLYVSGHVLKLYSSLLTIRWGPGSSVLLELVYER
jgi:hypothetical protein